ncbi:MAG TPA: HAMP domain-containing sensor histidine kinase [Ktedonobacterales bacterium]
MPASWPQRLQLNLTETIDHLLARADALPLPAPSAVLDQDGTITAANQAWQHVASDCGAPSLLAASIGQNYLTVCLQAANASTREARVAYDGLREVLDGALPLFTMEYPSRTADVWRWFLLQVTPLPGYAGGAIVQHFGISQHRLAEAEADERVAEPVVRSNAEQARIALRQSHQLQLVTGTALSHLKLAEALPALLDRIRLMMAADNATILLLSEDGRELVASTARGPANVEVGQVRVPLGQGVAGRIAASRRPLICDDLSAIEATSPWLREQAHALIGVPLLIEGRLMGVLHVSTQAPRHFTERELELLERAATPIALALDRARQFERAQAAHDIAEARANQMEFFMAMASHELRTPLTIIKMHQQIAEQWLGPRLPPEGLPRPHTQALASARQALREAQHAAERLSGLLEDLRLTTHARSGTLAMHPRRFDLGAIVQSVVCEQRQAHPERSVRLWLERRQPALVEADANRIEQVLTNYLNNAYKYAPADQPIDVRVRVRDSVARVAVRDHGPGLPEEEHARIWERFYQAPGIEPQGGTVVGLGLGLYISKHIIEQHQGQVGVESMPGKGATFWLVLPLAEQQPETAP